MEKEIGRELYEKKIEEIELAGQLGFATGEDGDVLGLNLEYIKLNPVPTSLSKFRHLKKLNLYGTKIKDISFLKDLNNLIQLDLRNNQLTDYSFLQDLSTLIKLDLSFNQLTDISFLQGLNNLEQLYLGHNQLTDISFLQALKKLNTLDLRNNQIKELPPKITELEAAIDVDYKYGGIGKIFLYNNPLEIPPLEIIKKGRTAIKTYFESLKEKKPRL